ncbi:MAG TPA: VOC family protein [Gemmatimonadaceae bacterium]|nr:VOC family protein [Gemmatimonadaceae bacterium]
MTTAAQAPGITSIGQIAINVQDLQRAVGFYRDKLGLKLLYEFPGLAFFDCGGVRLMMSRAEKAEFDHPASIIYYKVSDIQDASRALVAAGVPLEHEPTIIAKMPDHDLWMSFVRDSEGNVVGLMSEVSAST